MAVQDWSTTAGSNTTVDGIDIAENCAAANINNAIRAVMANVRAGVASKGTDITAAASIDLGAATGQFVDVTGNTGISAFGTAAAGTTRLVRFTGTPEITHNATSLILPTGANITAAAGDALIAVSLGSGNWVVPVYSRKSGAPMTISGLDGSGLTGIRKQGLETIWVPAAAMTPTVSNGCASLTKVETTAGRPDIVVLDFDASADEHAQFSVAFPKSWNESTVTFRVFHTTTATDTDGVAWGLQGVACSDGDTIDVAYGTAVVVTDAYQSTAEDMYVTDVSSAVTIAGTPAAGDTVFFRIFRDVSDAADTATEDARLIGVQIFFTTNATDDT
jgi:hypothetical protein